MNKLNTAYVVYIDNYIVICNILKVNRKKGKKKKKGRNVDEKVEATQKGRIIR